MNFRVIVKARLPLLDGLNWEMKTPLTSTPWPQYDTGKVQFPRF
jgi:hypothetical protein